MGQRAVQDEPAQRELTNFFCLAGALPFPLDAEAAGAFFALTAFPSPLIQATVDASESCVSKSTSMES